jgi:hypothetical protein
MDTSEEVWKCSLYTPQRWAGHKLGFCHFQLAPRHKHPEAGCKEGKALFRERSLGARRAEASFALRENPSGEMVRYCKHYIPAKSSVIPRSLKRFRIFTPKPVPPSPSPSGIAINVVESTISASRRA